VIRRAIAALCVSLMCSATLTAQEARVNERITVSLRGVPVVDALDRLVALSGISLVYDPAVVGISAVYCQAERELAETVLRCIVRDAGLDFYRLSSGTYVVIASVTQAPQFASFAGVVLDAQTGEPLPKARVALDEAVVTREANDGGAFTFPAVLPGRYRVRVQAIGYAPYRADLELVPGRPQRWRVPMQRLPVALELVAVTGLTAPVSVSLTDAGAVRTDTAVSMLRPGALFRAAANQLGVGQRALVGDLHIQGGEAGEHQFRLDGVPVFDPISLAQLFGSFTPLAIQRLTVRKAGFGVTHGSYTSGVIDLEHSLAGGRAGVTATVDPFTYSARVSGAMPLAGRQARGMLAARRSLWNAFPSSAVRNAVHRWSRVDRVLLDRAIGSVPDIAPMTPFITDASQSRLQMADVHGAARLDLGSFRALATSFYYSDNLAHTTVSASAPRQTSGRVQLATVDQYSWTTLGAQLRHEWFPSARMQHDVRVRYSRHALSHQHDASLQDSVRPKADAMPHEGNRVDEVAVEATLRYAATERSDLTFGVEAARTSSAMEMDNVVFRPVRSASDAWRVAQYTQWSQRLSSRVRVDAGLRLTWVPTFATVYGEPRLSLSGDHQRTSHVFAWKLAAGVHRQFVTQYELPSIGPASIVSGVRFWLPVDGTIRPPESYHSALEAVWRWPNGWEIRTEGYAKRLPTIPAVNFGVLLDHNSTMPLDVTQGMFITRSRGTSYGGGVRVSREAAQWRAQLGVDAGWSQRTFPGRFAERLQPTPWNEPLRVTSALAWQPRASIELSAQSRSVWNRSWALRRSYYDLTIDGLPTNNPGGDRLPLWQEVDLGASYDLSVRGIGAAVHVSVLNALGRANVLDQWLEPASSADGASFTTVSRAAIGRQFVLSVRLQR